MFAFLERCLQPLAVLLLAIIIWAVTSIAPLPRWLVILLLVFVGVLAFIAWLILVGG